MLLAAVEPSLVILQKRVPQLSQQTLARFVLRARRAVDLRSIPNVLVTSSTVVKTLNRQFRGKNKATDVLSFPSIAPSSRPARQRVPLAGDIAISADIARHNAARFGHSAAEEVKILALHGILHLAGFDHERDNGTMARKERRLRQRLHLPAALIERIQPVAKTSRNKKRVNTRATPARKMG
jgi:probable rRNA maturation factor